MNSVKIAEMILAASEPITIIECEQLAKAHLALLDKLKNPSDEVVEATWRYYISRGLAIQSTVFHCDIPALLKAANAVLLKEIE